MSLRKKCPYCYQKWPDGKDVAAGLQPLMSLRIADFVKGLSVHSTSMEADLFYRDIACEIDAEVAVTRLFEIDEAVEHLELVVWKLNDARLALAATPLMQSLPDYVRANADDHDPQGGLEKRLMVTLKNYRVVLGDEKMLFQDREEIEEEKAHV